MGRHDRKDFIKILNALGLLFICGLLGSAFYFQLSDHEIPCPLCLLQRLGLILAGFGFYFNLRMKNSYSHYSLVILSAVFTSGVAIRQVLLHILPGEPGYGSILFGLHFYTWSLISSVFTILIVVGIMILSDFSKELFMPQFLPKYTKSLADAVCLFFVFIIIVNAMFSFLECGVGHCPDNPNTYYYLLK